MYPNDLHLVRMIKSARVLEVLEGLQRLIELRHLQCFLRV